MGIIHQDFVIQKSYSNSLQDFDFSMGRKLRSSSPPIQYFILTIYVCHDRTKESSFVGKFFISLTHFTQRRQISDNGVLPYENKTRERQQQTNRNIHFQNTKIRNKDPRDHAHSSEEELFYCDLHIKSRLQIKIIVFPTNIQP